MPSANTDKRQREGGTRVYSYELPPIGQARKEFEEVYKAVGLIKWEEAEQQNKVVSILN